MKKIFAIVLALVMLFAICVPAFAVDNVIKDDTAQSANSHLQTSMQKEDGSDGASYTIRIPAEITIPWEKDAMPFVYNVRSQLESGKRLVINIDSANGKNELVDANGIVLPYSFSRTDDDTPLDSLDYTTRSEIVNTNRTFNIVIDDWNKVPVNEYEGNLTFTVEVVDA